MGVQLEMVRVVSRKEWHLTYTLESTGHQNICNSVSPKESAKSFEALQNLTKISVSFKNFTNVTEIQRFA